MLWNATVLVKERDVEVSPTQVSQPIQAHLSIHTELPQHVLDVHEHEPGGRFTGFMTSTLHQFCTLLMQGQRGQEGIKETLTFIRFSLKPSIVNWRRRKAPHLNIELLSSNGIHE